MGGRGHKPVVCRPEQRQSISAASTVNARGAICFGICDGALNAELFVDLLRKMMRHRKKPVHLILDSQPAHKKAFVRGYAKSTGKLTLHFLPGHASDLIPDELAWSHVTRTGVARRLLQQGEKLGQRIEGQKANLHKNQCLVGSFFDAPSVAAIAGC